MSIKIAIQGVEGSNHFQVVQDYFEGENQVIECLSFDSVGQALLDRRADVAVMAIENSIAGTIIPNYALIHENDFRITGEYFLTINHHLMVLPGQNIKDIEEIHSHPMALLQCKTYLKQYPHIKLVEAADTAESAKIIRNHKIKNRAAIAPKVSASLYKLDIIASNIQSIENNATRFIIVKASNVSLPESQINKASIRFVADHKRGSLAAILNVMSDCMLNLTKIQSLPLLETQWKYAFFVDVTFEDYDHFIKAQSLIKIMSEDFKILGAYKNARP